MLSNNFSYLPIWDEREQEPTWRLLSDLAVADYLRSALTKNKEDGRNERLAKTVEEALVSPDLALTEVRHCNSKTSVEEALALLEGPPVLVVDRDSHRRLVGILTPFDLL